MSRRDYLLILITGVGLILAFPPLPFGFIASVTLIPFFFFLSGKKISTVLKGGYFIGFIWGSGTIYWIGWATIGGLFGALLIFPLYFCLFAAVLFWLYQIWGEKSIWAVPFVWTGVELLSSVGSMGFPWNLLAHTQTSYLPMIQYADLIGAYGISFWVVWMNVVFYFMILHMNRKQVKPLILAMVLTILIPLGYGQWRMSQPLDNEQKINISLVQGNIDPYQKWDNHFLDTNFSIYQRLTSEAAKSNPDLIVWPETATACYIRYRNRLYQEIKSLVNAIHVPLLTGTQDFEWKEKHTVNRYNSAFFIRPDCTKVDRYHKMHLVPFSERVPLADKLPFFYNFLDRVLDLDVGNYMTGDSMVVFKWIPKSIQETVCFSVVICYESVFPYLVRSFIQKGAQFLVVITNDGWFGKTSGPFQHAQIAVLRAIENRIWVVRCANTGISTFIDPHGHIYQKSELYKEAVLNHAISVHHSKSFFMKYGNLFIWFIGMMNVMIVLGTVVYKKWCDA